MRSCGFLVLLSLAVPALAQNVDFNVDGAYTCADVELLHAAMRSPNGDLSTFDLDASGAIDENDADQFFGRASHLTGKTLVRGDFDLDGFVDHRDILVVGAHWQEESATLGYCDGDADGNQTVNSVDKSWPGVNWQAGVNSEWENGQLVSDHRLPADVEMVRERAGEGVVFARTSQFDLIGYRESVGEDHDDQLAATRIVARMRVAEHGFVTVDGLLVEGALHHVGIPGFFGSSPSARIDDFPAEIESWAELDSHLVIHSFDVSIAAGAGMHGITEVNDGTDPQQIAESIALNGGQFVPQLGLGDLSNALPTDIFALNHALRVPNDWNEVSLLRLVTPLDENGNPGEVFLTIGLQGADGDRNPLADVGIIESLSVPFFVSSGGECDLDLDGDCDGEDFDILIQTATDEEVDTWLEDANIVRGDADFDGDVDVVDLNQVAIHWQQPGDYGWRGGDFDGDGIANAVDLNQVGVNWQHGVEPHPASVPEPCSNLSLLAGVLCMLRFHRINRLTPSRRRRPHRSASRCEPAPTAGR